MAGKTYYDILGVGRDASQDDIRNAYKTLIKKYHPDVYVGNKDEATWKATELNTAYIVLSDPERRRNYDLTLVNQSRSGSGNAWQQSSYHERPKTENGGGCLGKLIVGVVLLALIVKGAGSCTPRNEEDGTRPVSSGEAYESNVSENDNTHDTFEQEAPDDQNDNLLSERAQVVANLYFHAPYTELGTVTIHNFDERTEVLEYISALTSDKELADSCVPVAYEDKLFGDDYYYQTAAETGLYYIGKRKDNRPHGFGAVVGLAEGRGTYALSDELLFYYVGNFKHGMKHGFGVEFNADECDISQAVNYIISERLISEKYSEHLCQYLFNHVSYEGFWKENKYHGKGNLFKFPTYDGVYFFHSEINSWLEGYIYGNAYPNVTQGCWENGELTGDAALYKFNHKEYIGQVKNGKANGRGTTYYSNDQVKYMGEFKNDVPHGEGTYYNTDGAVIYSGKWEYGDYAH